MWMRSEWCGARVGRNNTMTSQFFAEEISLTVKSEREIGHTEGFRRLKKVDNDCSVDSGRAALC